MFRFSHRIDVTLKLAYIQIQVSSQHIGYTAFATQVKFMELPSCRLESPGLKDMIGQYFEQIFSYFRTQPTFLTFDFISS